jgi:hypothetical protein
LGYAAVNEILGKLNSAEWWFTTILMGLVVGVTSAFLYDALSKRKNNQKTTGILARIEGPTESAPLQINVVVTLHIFLAVASIMWFAIRIGIEKSPGWFLVFPLGFGVIISAFFLSEMKSLAKASPRGAWIAMALSWAWFMAILIGHFGEPPPQDLGHVDPLNAYGLISFLGMALVDGSMMFWRYIRSD